MNLKTATTFINAFIKSNETLFGACSLNITEQLDAAIFPDELEKFKGQRHGLYIISTKHDSIVRYVGISIDMPSRIYQHIGSGITWARNGKKAHFPNCGLASGRPWQDAEEILRLKNADWEITGVFPDPPHIAGVLESAIIYFGKVRKDGPTINVAP